MVGVTPIKVKLIENKWRWFDYVERRSIDAMVRKSDMISINGNVKRKERPKLTWHVVIKKISNVFGFTEHITLDRTKWRKIINVANPTWLGHKV